MYDRNVICGMSSKSCYGNVLLGRSAYPSTATKMTAMDLDLDKFVIATLGFRITIFLIFKQNVFSKGSIASN